MKSMVDIPLLDNKYREAFLLLLDEISSVKECSDTKTPWYPQNAIKFLEAMGIYNRWHPEEEENFILKFPWPKPGEIPELPLNYLKPSEAEKNKIKAFLIKNNGPNMDPLTEMIVLLAKDIIQEVH